MEITVFINTGGYGILEDSGSLMAWNLLAKYVNYVDRTMVEVRKKYFD